MRPTPTQNVGRRRTPGRGAVRKVLMAAVLVLACAAAAALVRAARRAGQKQAEPGGPSSGVGAAAAGRGGVDASLQARLAAAEERAAEAEARAAAAERRVAVQRATAGRATPAAAAKELPAMDQASIDAKDPALRRQPDAARARMVVENRAGCAIPDPLRCEIGDASEQQWASRESMLPHLAPFAVAYARRPVATNKGGMRVNNMFALWFTLRSHNYSDVIESGVYRGQTTWLIRQALPHARIWSFDPANEVEAFGRAAATRMWVGDNFVDWTSVTWGSLGVDKARTLVVWDDHTDVFSRLEQMVSLGFAHAYVDDNYGSCVGSPAPRQLCDRVGGIVPTQNEIARLKYALDEVSDGGHSLREADPADTSRVLWDPKSYMENTIPFALFRERRRQFLSMVEAYVELRPIHWVELPREYRFADGTKWPPAVRAAAVKEPLFNSRAAAAREVALLGELPMGTEYSQWGHCVYVRLRIM